MNDEILERLLMDRCLGELSPDASALLDDWLGREPAAKAKAAELVDTLQLARHALRHDPAPAVLRPRFRAPAWIPSLAAMAACFAVGVGLTWLLLRPLAPPQPVAAITAPAEDSTFWSRDRLQAFARPAISAQPLVQWTSPVRQPQFRKQL
jgi:anti-sigma factor RsiW